jgi:beta-N-acetylglucosaminidase-like protein
MSRPVLVTPQPREVELLHESAAPIRDVRCEPSDGEAYTLEVSGGVAILTGATHHAEQTLRQLGPTPPAVRIADAPAMALRGVIEGFYGRPWSHRERLDLLAFCGRQKLNTFVWAPKDDPYHRESWREPYPVAELDRLAELVRVAEHHHVELAWAVAPGLSINFGEEAELIALFRKAEQLYGIGVRSFQLLWDDIPEHLLAEDAGTLHARVTNRFAAWLRNQPRTRPLVVCPLDYHGTEPTPYRDGFRELLDEDIVVYWTGPKIVSPSISRADTEAARAAFGRELLVWDNYPVNDFDPSRLFLGPLIGREGALPVTGLIANGMTQAAPSKLGLATAADYAWNPDAYDPERAFTAAIREVAGTQADALRIFADANRSGPLGGEDRGDPEALRRAAETLLRRLDDPWFIEAAAPWLDAALDRSVPRYARIPALRDEHAPLPERDDVIFVADKPSGIAARDSELPVIAWDGLIELGMAESADHSPLDDALTIVEPEHPLAAGLEGVVRIYRGPGRLRFGQPGPAATVVALGGDPPRPVLFAYDAGAKMPGGIAPARRVALFLAPEGLAPWLLGPRGRQLFEAALRWATCR